MVTFGPLGRLGDPWGGTSAPGPLPESIFVGFCLPFGLHFGSLLALFLGSIFTSFSGPLPEPPGNAFGRILVPLWFHFGSILGAFVVHFWKYLEKVKIELPLTREPHFHCPRGLENQCFSTFFQHSVQEASGAPSWSHF